jgi:hypothetical protein
MTLLSGDSPIGKLLSTLIDSFAKMPTETESKGAMYQDPELMTAFKESLKNTWQTNADMMKENLNSIRLDNQLKNKRLTEEF